MKKVTVLILTTFSFLIYSCDFLIETSTIADEYYPLKVGNKWYYNFDHPDTTVFNEIKEIIGITVINNYRYYITVRYGLPPNSYSDTSYSRTQKGKLFIGYKRKIDGVISFNENLIADFSLNIGDTIRTNEYDYMTITNKFDNIIEINWRADLWGRTKYQKGIGVIESITSNSVIHRRFLVKSELK
ncbi:MAG: hypothetical protein PVF17_05490 [Ignavibacteria bacterium]|jgi:hypothetical protein